MVVLFQQYTENICFFSKFSAGGLCDWGILLVISLEFQGKKHQPFSMVQPPKLLSYEDSPRNRIKKLCLQYVVETLSRQKQSHPITEPNISTIQYINHIVWQGISFLLFPKAIALRGQLASSLQSTFRQITLRLDPPGKSV